MNHFEKHLEKLKGKGYTVAKETKERSKAIKEAVVKSEKFHKEKLNRTMKYGKNFIGSAINKTLDKNK